MMLSDLNYGGLIKRDFDFINDNIFNVDKLFEKIKEFDNDLVERINTNDFNPKGDLDSTTEQENLEQFIYWYKLENNL